MQKAALLGIMAVCMAFGLAGAAMAAGSDGKYTVGGFTVHTLQDVDRETSVSIFSAPDEALMKKLAPGGKVPAGINAFLVVDTNRCILVDTGYGRAENPRSMLPEALAKAGVDPGRVTHVLLTHLHGDHVGGLIRDGKQAFPNALILVGKREYNFWTDPNTLKKNPGLQNNVDLIRRSFSPYARSIRTVDFGSEILPGITAVEAVGHTPGHTAFLIRSQGEAMLFWGDIVHGADLQFADPRICAQYDMDPEQSVSTRISMMEYAADKNTPVAGAHIAWPGVVTVRRAPDGNFAYQLQ